MSEGEARQPDFYWGGRPVYRCRFCRRYERVENLAAVEAHEQTHAQPVRTSAILGADGVPLQVTGTGDEK